MPNWAKGFWVTVPSAAWLISNTEAARKVEQNIRNGVALAAAALPLDNRSPVPSARAPPATWRRKRRRCIFCVVSIFFMACFSAASRADLIPLMGSADDQTLLLRPLL